MTKTEIIEGTKLIVGFTGIKCKEFEINHYTKGYRLVDSTGNFLDVRAYGSEERAWEYFYNEEAKYHEDWNLLIPVYRRMLTNKDVNDGVDWCLTKFLLGLQIDIEFSFKYLVTAIRIYNKYNNARANNRI